MEHTLQIKEEDTKQMNLVEQAGKRVPEIEAIMNALNPMYFEFLARMKIEDKLEISTREQPDSSRFQITGKQASQFIRKAPEEPVERMIESEFWVRKIDFTNPKKVKIQLERLPDGYRFRAYFVDGALNEEQKELLKNKSWDRLKIELRMLVTERNNKYLSAKITDVIEFSSPGPSQNPSP